MRFMTGFRLFFIGAMMTAGIIDLWASTSFTTPIAQLSASAVVGSFTVVGAKIVSAIL